MIILNEEDDPAQLNDKAQWIKFTIKNFRTNDINKEILCKKKSNRISMKVMNVKTKELNRNATERKSRGKFWMNNVKHFWRQHNPYISLWQLLAVRPWSPRFFLSRDSNVTLWCDFVF